MNGNAPMPAVVLTRFSMRRPAHRIDQRRALDWLAQVHAESRATLERGGVRSDTDDRDAFAARLRKVIDRCACGPSKIASRDHVIPDVGRTDWAELPIYDVTRHPHGQGTGARTRAYGQAVDALPLHHEGRVRPQAPLPIDVSRHDDALEVATRVQASMQSALREMAA